VDGATNDTCGGGGRLGSGGDVDQSGGGSCSGGS
jgi:hypothetical protein